MKQKDYNFQWVLFVTKLPIYNQNLLPVIMSYNWVAYYSCYIMHSA